jgi:hypothetical protein
MYNGYTTKFAGSKQNHKKINGTPNQIYQSKGNFLKKKKTMFRTKICMVGTRQNLQGHPKIQKKIIGTSNQPIRMKI